MFAGAAGLVDDLLVGVEERHERVACVEALQCRVDGDGELVAEPCPFARGERRDSERWLLPTTGHGASLASTS